MYVHTKMLTELNNEDRNFEIESKFFYDNGST